MVDVVIVGAGLAGLACAVHLEKAGRSVLLLDAQDAPGGRVRTDVAEGFRLDRGFQILLTAYPETESLLDYPALRLRNFEAGALVRQGGRFHHFADPFRDSLAAAIALAFDPIVGIRDKLLVPKLRRHVHRGSIPALFTAPEQPTRDYLAAYGFSPLMIERFWEPFLGGIFLEKELSTSSRYFEFLFRMFAFGATAVPEAGMESIPRQLAVRLRTDTLLTETRVVALRRERGGFTVENSQRTAVSARAVVIATEEIDARALLQTLREEIRTLPEPRHWNRTTTFYYAANRSPVEGALLVLNGDGVGAGPVNNVAVMSNVSSMYAPAGAHLVAASVVGEAPSAEAAVAALERDVRAQLVRWFGADAQRWRVLAGYPLEHALPLCLHAEWERSAPTVAPGVYLAGDYRETPSIQGALASGRRAAASILQSEL